MSGKDSDCGSLVVGRIYRWKSLAVALAVIAIAVGIRMAWRTGTAEAEPGGSTAAPSAQAPRSAPAAAPAQKPEAVTGVPVGPAPQNRIVAVVNNEPITRDELGKECLKRYGSEVLESVVNKYLIMQECQLRGLTVSEEEVNAEVERMATRFGMPVATWLKLLKEERGIKPEQYKKDIIWPTLALRKLAGDRMVVTEAELRKEFESRYGPAVKARLIVVGDREKAEKIRGQAVQDPERFGELAKDFSEDTASAGLKGLIQPIRMHVGDPKIEAEAFRLQPGEISSVLPIGNQFVILKCEERLPAVKVRFEDVRGELEELARDARLRDVAQEVFRELQQKARVENVWNDPQKRARMPDTAALINGRAIRLSDLAEMCIDRHGEEVLEGTISRKLLEQACRQRNITVTAEDMQAEIERAARQNLPLRADGKPNVEKWIELITQQQGIAEEVYRLDAVWPTVALKKLVGVTVAVGEEDLQKAFEANYGPRVRCRAILLNNLRRAQQVWEKLRANPSEEYFGDLAEQYSMDATTRALRGEIAPIQKHGGQPMLEQEAFSLKPGEISGIVQVGPEAYVILYCLGQTKPVDVTLEEVRAELTADLQEKKLRLAMADYYEKLRAGAIIDNYLAGTTQSPPRSGPQTARASAPAAASAR